MRFGIERCSLTGTLGEIRMAWEHIGDCGDGQIPYEREWLICQLELGISYLLDVCGEPPKGYELGIMWHEHDLGDYPTIGISWHGLEEAPWEYIQRCTIALEAFDEAIDWSRISPDSVHERFQPEIPGEEMEANAGDDNDKDKEGET